MKRLAINAAAVAAFLTSGCATIGTLGEDETRNKIYSGTVRHVELKCAHAACLDLPFSLVADTVLLPVTIPWTMSNFYCRGDAPERDDGAPSRDGPR